MVYQTGILIFSLREKKNQTEERKGKKKNHLVLQKPPNLFFWKEVRSVLKSNLFSDCRNLVVLVKATGQQAMAQGIGGTSQQGREKMP